MGEGVVGSGALALDAVLVGAIVAKLA